MMKSGMDYKKAKVEVVLMHLRKYYKYDEEEIDRISISEMRVTNDTVYIVVEENENI